MKSDSLWTACGTCGAQISTKAAACPHCGARRSRFRIAKWIGGGFLVLFVVGAIAGGQKPDGKVAAPTSGAIVPAAKSNLPPLPETQRQFLAVVTDYEGRFRSLPNELQQSMLRDERRRAFLNLIGADLRVRDWIGTVRKLETNTEGKAILTIRLAPRTDLMTWNNALSDVLHQTMIEKGTALYGTLASLAVGDVVTVSGQFIPSDEDGLMETSLTIEGAMTAPEFLFRFNTVDKQ